jgi:hypothetical protein
MAITSIKLINGGSVPINTHLTLGALREAQIKGFLNKDFISSIMKVTIGNSDEFDFSSLPVDDLLLMDLAYVCYKLENKNPMSIEDFLNAICLDFTGLSEIYFEVITNLTLPPGNMPKDFKEATPRQKSNGKKKKHHH